MDNKCKNNGNILIWNNDNNNFEVKINKKLHKKKLLNKLNIIKELKSKINLKIYNKKLYK